MPKPNVGLAGWLPKRPIDVAGCAVAVPKPPQAVLAEAAPNSVAGAVEPKVGATAPKGFAGSPNMPPAWVVVEPKPEAGDAVVAAGAPKADGLAPKSPPA